MTGIRRRIGDGEQMTAHDCQIPDEVRFIRERLDALERERMRLSCVCAESSKGGM
jgi:hypothetical protein